MPRRRKQPAAPPTETVKPRFRIVERHPLSDAAIDAMAGLLLDLADKELAAKADAEPAKKPRRKKRSA
jgi:hypothetical protein